LSSELEITNMLSSILHEVLTAPESAQITIISLTGINGFRAAPKNTQVWLIGVITLVALLKI
jgi:hypothetical protein